MNIKILSLVVLFASLSLITISCKETKNITIISPSKLGIDYTVPSLMGSEYVDNFNRYTKVITPNGGAIHIVAQNEITDEQIIRCRSVLEHFLANLPGSKYGADKSSIANKMAENNAILCLLNDKDGGRKPVRVKGQALFQKEIQVEGGSWYMNQNYEHRDATFEEILHLVHDYGIGVDGHNTHPGASPAFQTEIRLAQKNALDKNIWGIGATEWIDELAEENSLSQEYLASVIDNYYGLWGAWTEEDKSMWGLYIPKVRSEMINDDPMGAALMDNSFFHSYLTYNARIDASLTGTFSLKFDASRPYTNHSQYLKNITLLGSNNSSVIVNDLDNNITGNKGTNTVIFSGKKSEYTIVTDKDTTTVTDNTPNRDGVNRLKQIEKLQFTDQIVTP